VLGALLDALAGLPGWLALAAVCAVPMAEAGLLVGVVFPGEAVVLLGGVLAHEGAFPLWAVVLAAGAGAIVGDQAGYAVGRHLGTGLLRRIPERLRRRVDIGRMLALVRTRGTLAVVFGRWVAVMRAVVPGVAGASGMPWRRFLAANVVGGSLWATAVCGAGFLAGASYRVVERDLGGAAETAAVLVALAGAAWIVTRHRRRVGPQ
jgi:membrane-associated protein